MANAGEEVGAAVGYGKPPRRTRFRKGRSGNPGGRRLRPRNFAALLGAALDMPAVPVENGKRRRATKREVIAATRYQPQTDEIMRLHAQTAMIENGFFHLPEEAPWLAEYLDELRLFPNGRHDDRVGSTLGSPRDPSTSSGSRGVGAQALDWFKRAGREPGIIAYYRMLAEERAKSDGKPLSGHRGAARARLGDGFAGLV